MIHLARSWTAQQLAENLPANEPKRAFWDRLAALEFRINTLDGSGYTATWNFSGNGYKVEANTMQECLRAAIAVIDQISPIN